MKPLMYNMLCSAAIGLTAGVGYTLVLFASRKALKHDLYEAMYRANVDSSDYSVKKSKEFYDSMIRPEK